MTLRAKRRPPAQTALLRRVFLGIAFLLGAVGILIGGVYLAEGEFTVRYGSKIRGAWKGGVVGHVRQDDLLFYPIAVGWIAVGTTSVVAAPLALMTGSRACGQATAGGAAGFALLSLSTVGAASWYGDDSPRSKEPVPAVAPATPAAQAPAAAS